MSIKIERATEKDWDEVAELIYDSTNAWYQKNRGFSVFQGDRRCARLYCETYEALDGPENLVIARETETGRIVGSCFMHPRPTHYSLGIMNVHPDCFGKRIASQLLCEIIQAASVAGKTLRLFSSAMNLDSYNLYNRHGFAPYLVLQDMMVPNFSPEVPLSEGVKQELARVRPATLSDVSAIVALEKELVGIDRTRDFTHFIENPTGVWTVWVLENAEGRGLDGVLASSFHASSHMLGPGAMRTEEQLLALTYTGLTHYARTTGSTPVFLVPSKCREAIRTLYSWGAKNTEIHVGQALGEVQEPTGLIMPTFFPESA